MAAVQVVVAHPTAEAAEARASRLRATVSAEQWKEGVVAAYLVRDWESLGYESWAHYVGAELPGVPLTLEQRRQMVAGLTASGLSSRAIATVLRVAQGTVMNDRCAAPGEPAQGLANPVHVKVPYVPNPEPKKRARTPLPTQFLAATAGLDKAVARFEKLRHDDRYRENRAAINQQCGPQIRRALEALTCLVEDLQPQHQRGEGSA